MSMVKVKVFIWNEHFLIYDIQSDKFLLICKKKESVTPLKCCNPDFATWSNFKFRLVDLKIIIICISQYNTIIRKKTNGDKSLYVLDSWDFVSQKVLKKKVLKWWDFVFQGLFCTGLFSAKI